MENAIGLTVIIVKINNQDQVTLSIPLNFSKSLSQIFGRMKWHKMCCSNTAFYVVYLIRLSRNLGQISSNTLVVSNILHKLCLVLVQC